MEQSSTEQTMEFGYQGEGGKLFGLYLKNILMSIITLGIYSFWGKVEINKYLFSHINLADRSFGYHATGKEKFRAFVIAIVFFLGVFALLGGIGFVAPKVAPFIMGVAAIAFYFWGIPFVVVGKHQFLLSRTSWSNVRFRFNGTYKGYLPIHIKGLLLTIVTLGIYSPWFINNTISYLLNNSNVGDKSFSYDGNGKDFFFMLFKGYLLTIITLGIYGPWMMADVYKYFIGRSKLENGKLKSEITGGDIWLIYLAIIFSFGIALPFALNHAFKVFFSKLSLEGSPEDLANIQNVSDSSASALADGFSEAADAAEALASIV